MRWKYVGPVLLPALGALLLTGAGVLSQEGGEVIGPMTEKMLLKVDFELVRRGQGLSSYQEMEVNDKLRPKMEAAERKLRTHYRSRITKLLKIRSDIKRYEDNGQFDKANRFKKYYNQQKSKLEEVFEQNLAEIRDEFLRELLNPKQLKVLGLEPAEEDEETPEENVSPRTRGKRLRESDFY
jgi:hypothetical protein